MAISFLQIFGGVISELRWLFVVNIRTKPPFRGEGGEAGRGGWEGGWGYLRMPEEAEPETLGSLSRVTFLPNPKV